MSKTLSEFETLTGLKFHLKTTCWNASPIFSIVNSESQFLESIQ